MLGKRTLVLVMAIVLCLACFCTSAGAIDISIQDGKLVVDAGEYPDLTGDIDDVQNQISGQVVSKEQTMLSFITAICALVCVGALIISITKVSTSGSHAIQRRQAMVGVMWSCIGIAMFGGAFVIIRFFWSFLS